MCFVLFPNNLLFLTRLLVWAGRIRKEPDFCSNFYDHVGIYVISRLLVALRQVSAVDALQVRPTFQKWSRHGTGDIRSELKSSLWYTLCERYASRRKEEVRLLSLAQSLPNILHTYLPICIFLDHRKTWRRCLWRCLFLGLELFVHL